MEEQSKQRVEVPLLKAYLRMAEGKPPHVPSWISYPGWIVGLGSYLAMDRFADPGVLGFFLAIALGYMTYQVLRNRYKPRTAEERADETLFNAVGKMQHIAQSHNISTRFPPEVLHALERAVGAYNSVNARLTPTDPGAVYSARTIQQLLHATFVAALAVHRHEEHSRKEWNALLGNQSAIRDAVDAIDAQTRRIRAMDCLDYERLAALQELESFDRADVAVVEDAPLE